MSVSAERYIPILALTCPDVMKVRSIFPTLFCLGALGPCNGANFKLPPVNNEGIPTDFKAVALFYNTAKFAEILPALNKQGVTPPCYESCRKAVETVTACPSLKGLGLDATYDSCAGLPKKSAGEVCIEKPGPKPAPAGSQPGKGATENKDKPAGSNAAPLKTGLISLALAALAFI